MKSDENDSQKAKSSKATDGVATVVKWSDVGDMFASVHPMVPKPIKKVHGAAKVLNPAKIFKKSQKKSRKEALYGGLRTLDAEEYLIKSLEERGRRTVPNADGFRPAIEGERAPLGIDTVGNAFDEEAPPNRRPNYSTMARMVFQKRSVQTQSVASPLHMGKHERVHSLLNSINKNQDENLDTTHSDEAFLGPSEIIVDESYPLLGEPIGNSSVPYERLRKAYRNGAKKRCRGILACLNPLNIIRRLLGLVLLPFFVWALSLFLISWVLFYQLGNPELDFLPGEATISWWFNFAARHVVLLQVSYILQTILIDWVILSSRLVMTLVGPWATIFCLQSRGWPFLVGCWGMLAIFFLQGDDAFSQHWLRFTGIKIYTEANSGSYIIASSTYLRVLFGMVLAGITTSLKRTIVALYFGRRSFDLYKTQLEKLLNDVILVSEVAALSAAADEVVGSSDAAPTTNPRGGDNIRWSSIRFDDRNDQNLSDDGDDDDDSESDDDNNEAENKGNEPKRSFYSNSAESSVKNYKIKNALGRWDDPLNKTNKRPPSSVSDILKFRKALTYMDLEHPFSQSFGPASTRDELLTSAQVAYSKLLMLSGEDLSTLPFSALAVLTENGDGTLDKQKRKDLKRIFPPDGSGNVSLLAFVMGCDTVYKKLRYFRASVGNSSVIDNVLEHIVDSIFFFVLVILILSLLDLNPWPLLVSTSTLLLTFTFAVGPSCEKAIAGIILIVGRRPYDIGDRIIISDNPGGGVNGTADSWFVEDITLFTTTLRFGANNEVATVSNGSIAQARITNCAKSMQAIVQLVMRFDIRFHEGTYLQDFQESIEEYVLNNPNRWDSVSFFRCEEIDTDNEVLVYQLRVRSTLSWQPAPRVLEHRAQLARFCSELSIKMGVNYASPLPTRVIYSGGEMLDNNNPKVNRAKESSTLIE